MKREWKSDEWFEEEKNEVNAFYSLNLRRISGATSNSLE